MKLGDHDSTEDGTASQVETANYRGIFAGVARYFEKGACVGEVFCRDCGLVCWVKRQESRAQ